MPHRLMANLDHLSDSIKRFVVSQAYDTYTPVNHQTWVDIMAELKPFWNRDAHPDFLKGLEKTGISLDKLPCIEHIDESLKVYGWRAVTVDGYVHPEVFMGLQTQRIIPIARDIRKPENLDYTPAPDIVHEAAAHVPLLINEEYGDIVQKFGTLSLKAGFSQYDKDTYEAVRYLSQIKEDPNTDPAEIAQAEAELERVSAEEHVDSVGKKLTRFYWWTIEYGILGDINGQKSDRKVYGAGLLSSPGEGRMALNGGAELLPLNHDAFEQEFDITKPQPQLYVTPDFKTIDRLLDEFAAQHGL